LLTGGIIKWFGNIKKTMYAPAIPAITSVKKPITYLFGLSIWGIFIEGNRVALNIPPKPPAAVMRERYSLPLLWFVINIPKPITRIGKISAMSKGHCLLVLEILNKLFMNRMAAFELLI